MELKYPKTRCIFTFLFPVILQLLQVLPGNTQDLVSADRNFNERIFTLRVKQLTEFIDRFNYEKDFSDNQIDEYFSSKISRSEYIRLLFNEEDIKPDTGSTDEYLRLTEEFIREIGDSCYRINKYSERIFAELNCLVSCNNIASDISIVLNQEVSTGLKWMICGINKEFINELSKNYHPADSNFIPQAKYDSSYYIPPYSNETNFIVLQKLLNRENENSASLNSSFYNPAENNIFYYLISQEIIKFIHVKKISYYIFDIPGWSITVNNFTRNTENSGWLISDIGKANSRNYLYFKETYNIEIAD